MVFVDLDNFKFVNDSLGHEAGDSCSRHGRTRCSAACASDTVARLGGDEFVILLDDIRGRSRCYRSPSDPSEFTPGVRSSAGRECPPRQHGNCAEGTTCYKRADDSAPQRRVAMYRAKSARQGPSHRVRPGDASGGALLRLELESDLRRAMEHAENFRLLPADRLSLARARYRESKPCSAGVIPSAGLVTPGEFIPIAEETGLTFLSGSGCRQVGLSKVRRWQIPAYPPLRLSVNLSPRQFQRPALVDEVARAVREAGLPPDCLKLEITEGVIMRDVEATIDTLSRLKDSGIKLAIDDFGTGYSSLPTSSACRWMCSKSIARSSPVSEETATTRPSSGRSSRSRNRLNWRSPGRELRRRSRRRF